jgi:hypothetical protein
MPTKTSEELKNKIEKEYLQIRSMRELCRTLNVGIKRVRRVLKEKGYDTTSSQKVFHTTVNIGDRLGRWKVVGLPFKNYEDRYVIPVKCECGTELQLRPVEIIKQQKIGCRHCANKNNLPTFRTTRSCKNSKLKEFSSAWLSSIKNYSHRGLNRIIRVEIDSFDLLNQLKKQNFKCAYTNIDLRVLNLSKGESNASVDRIDSTKDYTIDNIQWVYRKINRIKNDCSNEEFITLCRMVASFRHDNFEPSSTNGNLVVEKVQRLTSEEPNQ